ncbi:kinesin protein [Salix suchowensis]|nr:kinesin protein [Salix suchowensis]
MEDSNSTNDQLPQWHDPLLLTDVQQQQQEEDNTSSLSYSSNTEPISSKFQTLAMVDSNSNEGNVGINYNEKMIDRVENDAVDGRSMLGFSLTSPDLVICAGSPDLSRNGYRDSPELLDGKFSIELSLENGIDGSDMKDSIKTPCVKFSSVFQTFNKELSPESSFELLPHQEKEEKLVKDLVPGVCINAGCTDRAVVLGGVEFLGDDCFLGGDHVRTDATIGDGQNGDLSLYQTARYGNFSYCFRALEPGNYDVSLHLAEIVFTDGPPGLRVFDVFVQEKKVVSCLDIYAQVGANRPLVVSDLKAFVEGDEGLLIRFEGVMGKPIVCGISITKPIGMSLAVECDSSKENGHLEVEGDYQKLLKITSFRERNYRHERAMDELKRENRLKSRECQDALKSLQELQNELMRKSMHVGSLAFAIEGQVKEKSRWFTSLRDLTRKLKIMKMEHIKLSEEALAYKNCLVDMDEIRSTILSKMKQQVDLHEDLKIKFVEGAKERKELYNKVLELKGGILNFESFLQETFGCFAGAPLKSEEVAAGASMTIDFESAKDGELTVMSNGLPKKTFKFDAVFGPRANQADVFEDTASFASSVLDGYNVCIFAYGQTGTGKTFTMEGTDDDRGEREKLFRYDVSVSVLEVYNEQIQDLLVSDSQPGVAAKRLEIRQAGEGLHHVPGLVEANVHNMSEVWEVLQTGSNARAVGSTNANEHSSRSHCIHCVMVKGENLLNGECTKSKLWLVDLAGSERIAKTEVQGERLKETQNINKSLSALGDVISALATKSPHIPFRNSKLTHLLQDSLGGDSKTLMFVQISPNENDLGETICSLNFASRVRGIELGPAKRQLDNAELLRYKQMAEKSKQDLKSKDVQIKKLEDTINGLDLKTKEKDFKYKILQDKVKELEAQLLVERKLARQHVDTKIAEQQQQQQMKQHQDEQIIAPPRPPLANRILGSKKNFDEPVNGCALNKEHINLTQPLKGNTSYKSTIPLPSTEGIVKLTDSSEKENNPVMADQPRFLKKTGRASICTTAKRVLAAPVPRRNSMIPLPSVPSIVQLPSIPSSFPLCQEEDMKEDSEGSETNCLPEHTQCDSPRDIRYGSKRISTMLKRSLQKKGNMKVSIGSRGRIAHRVLLGNGRRTGMREAQQKQMPGEKERRWNSGTVARTPI